MELNTIYTGDALDVLRKLLDGSVDCVVTSPPYYGLRNYGVSGQIGLEETPGAYIAKLMDVFREVRRILKPAGTLWLNIGDSYNGSGKANGCDLDNYLQRSNKSAQQTKPTRIKGLKPKDLIGIPWMMAFALRSDGWYLRQDIIWHKTNPMPESVLDRCTKSHEYIFLLSKSSKYWFDHEAMLEPAAYDGRKDTFYKGGAKDVAGGAHERWPNKMRGRAFGSKKQTGTGRNDIGNMYIDKPARNKRDVWTVPTRSFKGAHFATYPEALIVDCVKAGCPPGGVVLDPFFGAGTTGVVARNLGRNYIGIELNAEYVGIANKRISAIVH
jgi:DNA modification methylase